MEGWDYETVLGIELMCAAQALESRFPEMRQFQPLGVVRQFKASLTRELDLHVTLRDRARFANETGADLFLSIHADSLHPSSNASWNQSIGSGATFTAGFNGTFSGANNPPTSFTLNGVACNGGGSTNTPPIVSLSSPTSGQTFPASSTMQLAATASDPGGAVSRVEFRVDGNPGAEIWTLRSVAEKIAPRAALERCVSPPCTAARIAAT